MEQFYNNVKTKIKTEKQKVKKINDELNDIMSDRFKLCDRENELISPPDRFILFIK